MSPGVQGALCWFQWILDNFGTKPTLSLLLKELTYSLLMWSLVKDLPSLLLFTHVLPSFLPCSSSSGWGHQLSGEVNLGHFSLLQSWLKMSRLCFRKNIHIHFSPGQQSSKLERKKKKRLQISNVFYIFFHHFFIFIFYFSLPCECLITTHLVLF